MQDVLTSLRIPPRVEFQFPRSTLRPKIPIIMSGDGRIPNEVGGAQSKTSRKFPNRPVLSAMSS